MRGSHSHPVLQIALAGNHSVDQEGKENILASVFLFGFVFVFSKLKGDRYRQYEKKVLNH